MHCLKNNIKNPSIIKCPETILNIICTKKLIKKFKAAQIFYVQKINLGKNFL